MTVPPRMNRGRGAGTQRWNCLFRFGSATTALLGMLAGCRAYVAPASLALTFDVGSRREVGLDGTQLGASARGIRVDPATQACVGAGDYRKFTSSTQVLVRDERGDVLGSARLGPGRVIAQGTRADGAPTFRGCRFAVSIPLKRPARIYSIDVADGEFHRSHHITELAARQGVVAVELD